MITVMANGAEAYCKIEGEMKAMDLLMEASCAALSIISTISKSEGEGVARVLAKIICNALEDDETLDEILNMQEVTN